VIHVSNATKSKEVMSTGTCYVELAHKWTLSTDNAAEWKTKNQTWGTSYPSRGKNYELPA